MNQDTVLSMESIDEQGVELKVTIEGKTDMPFWKHDLKLKVVKSLLETIDKKDFYEADKDMEFYQEIEEIKELLDAISR